MTGNKRLLGVIFLSIAILVTYFVLLKADYFPIRKVKVHAPFLEVSADEIKKLASPFLASGFFHLSNTKLEKKLSDLSWVEKVSVQRTYHWGVIITLTEKKAVARWGSDFVISAKGEILKPKTMAPFNDLPLLIGEKGNEKLVVREYQNIAHIFNRIGQKVSMYRVSPRFSRELTLASGVTIDLGKQAAETRLNRFIDVYFAMFHDKFDNISYIDLRYPKGLAVRYKNTASGIRQTVSI